MTTVRNGLVGGLLVALVAATTARLVGTEPSTASAVLEIAFGDAPTPSGWWGYVLLLLHGSIAGGTLVALDLFVFGTLGVPPTVDEALVVAIVWSGVLLGTAIAVWRFVLGLALDRSSLAELLAYHLVYGLGLAIWARMTWIT